MMAMGIINLFPPPLPQAPLLLLGVGGGEHDCNPQFLSPSSSSIKPSCCLVVLVVETKGTITGTTSPDSILSANRPCVRKKWGWLFCTRMSMSLSKMLVKQIWEWIWIWWNYLQGCYLADCLKEWCVGKEWRWLFCMRTSMSMTKMLVNPIYGY